MSGVAAHTRLVDRCGERMARCLLTYCIDGADALMMALLKGAPHALAVFTLLVEGLDGHDDTERRHAERALDHLFSQGAARWGCHVKPQGLQAFHRALKRWRARLQSLPTWEYDALTAWMTHAGTQWVVIPGDDLWPERLGDLAVRSDWAPPLCLWGIGDRHALAACSSPVAVVGSRGVNEYGRHVAGEIAHEVAMQGHTVVSGGAMGTDAIAHWGALRAVDTVGGGQAGRTIAVFAGGLDHMGPTCNQRLFEAIRAQHGALVSEMCPQTVPEARRFLLRNRIIAALCPTVVIAQARRRSGALNTAHWAAELNREVYAVPGNITAPDNAGCNELIRNQQAILLAGTTADDLCHAAHTPHLPKTDPAPDAPVHDDAGAEGMAREQAVLGALERMHRTGCHATPDTLAEALQADGSAVLSLEQVHATLGLLELQGRISTAGGRIAVCTAK